MERTKVDKKAELKRLETRRERLINRIDEWEHEVVLWQRHISAMWSGLADITEQYYNLEAEIEKEQGAKNE